MPSPPTPPRRVEAARRLLAAHRPLDAAEAAHRRATLALLDAHGARAFRRDAYAPGHLTASGFVLHPAGDRVLLVHHARLGLWIQPGGHVEPGDPDLPSAARREVTEETGLRELRSWPGVLDVDVHRIPAGRGEPAHLHHDVRFLFTSARAEARALDGVRATRWVPLDHAPEDPSVARALARIRALLAAGSARVGHPVEALDEAGDIGRGQGAVGDP